MTDLPPSIRLLLEENIPIPEQAPRTVYELLGHDLVHELQRQARWTLDHFDYAVKGTAATLPTGALNPFSGVAKCSAHRGCVEESAAHFVQTAGLYSDVVLLPDELTHILAGHDPKALVWSQQAFRAVTVLKAIAPLIRAGLVRFAPPYSHLDTQARAIRDQYLKTTAAALIRDHINPLTVRLHMHDDALVIGYTTPLLSPPGADLWRDAPVTDDLRDAVAKALPFGEEITLDTPWSWLLEEVERTVGHQLLTTLDDVICASGTDSIVLAGSRVESLYLSELTRHRVDTPTIEQWEALRSVNLPWINSLSAQQLLLLRADAGVALPKLRHLLHQALREHDTATDRVTTLVSELRAQAAEVEAELKIVASRHSRRYTAAIEGLATTFVIYGLSTGIPALGATAIAAFLATQAHLYTVTTQAIEKAEALRKLPGYALVAAKRLQQRTDGGTA